MKKTNSTNWMSLALASPFGAMSLFFAWLFYIRYWKWKDCINEALSSCQTPDGALTEGGRVWAVPAIFFAALFLAMFFLSRKLRD